MSAGPKNQFAKKQQQSQIPVNIKDADPVACDQCNNQTFQQVVVMKKLSAIMSPTGKLSYVPIPVFACNSCGWVNKEFLPNDNVSNGG